jgi:hypothetical protein
LTPLTPREDADARQSVVPAPNNVPYLIAVVAMMMVGVAGVVTVEVLRPTADNLALNASILGFLAPTTLSLLAFMKSQETHLSVNSRLDAFMANARMAAHAQGINEGRQQGRDAANERTDTLAAAPALPHTQTPIPVEVVNQPLTVTTEKDPPPR